LVDGSGFTELEIAIVNELVERWVGVDPDSHLPSNSQETAICGDVHLPHFVEDLLATEEQHLEDIQHFFKS
jgi:hypothetical protein